MRAGPGSLLWPREDAPQAVDGLARELGLLSPQAAAPGRGVVGSDVGLALTDTAERLGLHAQRARLRHGDLDRWLAAATPGLLMAASGDGILAVTGRRRGRIAVLGADRRRRLVSLQEARSAVGGVEREASNDDAAGIVETAGLSGGVGTRVADALRRERRAAQPWGTAWRLTRSPGSSLAIALGLPRLAPVAGLVLAAAFAEGICLTLAWWVLGKGALSGPIDPGWLWAFFLLLLSILPLQAVVRLGQGRLAYRFSAALQARLHLGALRLSDDEARRDGTGRTLGRVFESARLDAFGLSAAFAALSGAVQLPLAWWVLAHGAAPRAGPLLLAGAVVTAVLVTALHYRRLRMWIGLRTEHTHGVVELMLGHRTRLAQESLSARHREEDSDLARLFEASRLADATAVPLMTVLPRSFFTAGLLAQGLALLGEADLGRLAVGLAGVLLGQGALQGLCLGARDLCLALLAWKQVRGLALAASRQPLPASDELAAVARAGLDAAPVIDARDLGFTYPGRAEAAIAHAHLTLKSGDRVLMEGPTGAGKSTLVALLGGLRQPTRGAVHLRGLDRGVWGDRWWRRQVVLAPQFQENHVFAAPLAFNVLLGRRWPPDPEDMIEAEAVCRELGLGPLIDRMPSMMLQPVGETGWQLSHGERTRVFLARALLQKADVVLLDESFAALDPATLQTALECARRRARTLVVVAHP